MKPAHELTLIDGCECRLCDALRAAEKRGMERAAKIADNVIEPQQRRGGGEHPPHMRYAAMRMAIVDAIRAASEKQP